MTDAPNTSSDVIEAEADAAEDANTEPAAENVRLVEALLFASAAPMEESRIASRLPEDTDVRALLKQLQALYESRGVNLVRVGRAWAFRTAPDLADVLVSEREQKRRLSRAAVESLAVIAYHQPVTRGEIEEIRGVTQSKGTLDALMEAGWIKPGRRRETPGRPVTWMTTPAFLDQFGLESLRDLPGVAELKASGFLDARPAIQAFRTEDLDEDSPEEDDDHDEVEEEEGDDAALSNVAPFPQGRAEAS